jgi:predicted RNase H-related nuclease YkuK (DUF458 family)
MIFEVGKSIEVAYELSPLLESYGFNVEIHADINPTLNMTLTKLYNKQLVTFRYGV